MDNIKNQNFDYVKMVKLSIIVILSLLILIFLPTVHAIQPTQQYNKIYLTPFYRDSLSANTNYNYNLTINPPDRIGTVNSAIITFNAQINGQTQNFTLSVNGQSCSNPYYYIATAFSTTGTSQIYFDCTNRIKGNGTYNIVLRSNVAVGTVQGWIDLTYMNSPKGDMEISGTEYTSGDIATMFVQLKNSQGIAIQNGSCYLDIWYPLNISNVHPYTVQDAPMLQALGDDGIYYYDMIAPSQLGVYMLSAKCSYSYNWMRIYPEYELTYYPIRNVNSGTWYGSSQVLNSRTDSEYERCDSTAGALCQANYTFNISQYGSITNITNINLYYAGYGDSSGKTITFSYWNGTTFVNLPNILTISSSTLAYVLPVDQFVSNSIPLNAVINDTIIIRYTGQPGIARLYNNWLSISLLSSSGTIEDLKGSSEMHVTDIPKSVWNYTSRNLTYYQNFSISQTDLTNYTKIQENQYNYTNRFNSIDNVLLNINSTIISQFSILLNNMTAQFNNVLLQIASVPQNVWTYLNRNLTYYPAMNITLINNVTVQNVTVNVTTQNVTVQNVTVNVNNVSVITQNLTVNLTNQYVIVENITMNLTVQNVTVQNVTVNVNNVSFNTSLLIDDIWNYTARYTHGVILN